MAKSDELKADLQNAAKDVRSGVTEAKDRVADATKDAVAEGKEAASDLAARASDAAGSAADSLRSAAGHGADMAKDVLAGTREALNATGEKVADTLRSARDHADLKAVQDKVTEAVAATAEALRDTRISDVAGDLRESARRNPGMFILGAAVAGFALGCWMQSSATRSRSDDILRRLRS
ncbi:hypothetical protein [Falsigemmobacter faecalis]|uniref:DUF883 family protein n=1 Tax=Falsigemmobacter faecalis TaxID=2488730 RepID=A0A3P3DBV7_9RHOB|nr:hypothetical protein [Falsigemmobacter faecalis]RRH69868.1 hypothetical protein EG244_17860 [Falsigemmobacter faecalis]